MAKDFFETGGTVGAAALYFEGATTGNVAGRTVVAHKTGTVATVKGLNGAANDVRVATLPGNAGPFAMAVYIKASTRNEAARDRVIARMA